jgi:hypothetical protein
LAAKRAGVKVAKLWAKVTCWEVMEAVEEVGARRSMVVVVGWLVREWLRRP